MKKIPPGTTCYACEEAATTWEHAPPKSFFPKYFEMPIGYKGPDLRSKPILVPSCELHNNAKSQSDGYASTTIAVLAHAMSGSFSDDFIRAFPFLQKKIATVQTGRRLSRDFIEHAKPLLTIPAYSMSVEIETLNEVVGSAARALYYRDHSWKRRWPQSCKVVSPHFRHRDLRQPANLEAIEHMLLDFESENVKQKMNVFEKGSHPSIFSYQTIEDPRGGALVMKLKFYGYFLFLAMADPSQTTALSSVETSQ
jgi:hypothetical protein